jgi:hypothetical protein
MKEDNARFWVWHRGGWVKLTLTPGQVLSTFQSQQTDEGYCREASTFAHHGETVGCEWYETGRDCDGRYERGGELVCDLADLAARDAFADFPVRENVGIRAPEWQRAGGYRRDHAAESAGY